MADPHLLSSCLFLRRISLAIMLLLLDPGLVAAQNISAGEWNTDCNKDRCLVSRSLLVAGQERKFLTLILLLDKIGNENLMVFTTPLGIAVEPGVQSIVGEETWNSSVKVCFPDGCQAIHPMTDENIALLRSKESIDVRYFPYGSEKPLAGIVPLDGLDEALSAIGE